MEEDYTEDYTLWRTGYGCAFDFENDIWKVKRLLDRDGLLDNNKYLDHFHAFRVKDAKSDHSQLLYYNKFSMRPCIFCAAIKHERPLQDVIFLYESKKRPNSLRLGALKQQMIQNWENGKDSWGHEVRYPQHIKGSSDE